MEMKPTNNCTRCNRFAIERGYECRACHSVTLCMVTVHHHWRLGELEALAGLLDRQGGIFEFIKECEGNNRFLSLKLARRIVALAYPAGITPDELKRGVVKAIRDYIKEMREVAAWERENNKPGSYMEHFRATVGSWIGKASASTTATVPTSRSCAGD